MVAKKTFSKLLAGVLAFSTALTAAPHAAFAAPLSAAYEHGIEPQTSMGKELIDILSSYPNMGQISYELTGDQKFRVPFGPTYWRMLLQPNTIKVLFIGQDGTHVAEAAGKTATAGFGGRAQDLAAYFGVRESAGFINAFAPTIYGQYGAFNSPVFVNGGEQVRFSGFVDNQLWLMSQDPESPLFKWRARLIEWIIKNNKDSLKLIVLFGGAARDVIGSFVESRGGKVGTRVSEDQLKTMSVPLTILKAAGGNNEYPALMDTAGEDLYEKILGRKIDYTKPEEQTLTQKILKEAGLDAFKKSAILPGGLHNSGIVHPAQLGGFDLSEMEINGRKSISLKGLKLSDGSSIANDVLVVQSPHPTALSMMKPDEASNVVGKALKPLAPFVSANWSIQPDAGMQSTFAQGQPYAYRRTDIPAEYYDFGTPNNRMVSRSDASRLKSNIIVIGTRDRAPFDTKALAEMTKAQPAKGISEGELFVTRPRTLEQRNAFDAGPGDDFAKLMKDGIDMDAIAKPKSGMKFETDGIAAYNVKTHPENVGDFGHYRGTFKSPRVLVLADPDGNDDMLTSRALTGARGQYLQSLMNSLGIPEQYVVLKTVPFGMDGATADEWSMVLSQTKAYREKTIAALIAKSKPELVIADGPNAAAEARRLIKGIKIVVVKREGTENASGLADAARELNVKFDGEMSNIPRSHLTLLSRTWEGTSGSHVLDSSSPKYKGLAFAVVAPEWAYKQKLPLTIGEQRSVDSLKRRLSDLKLPQPGQSFQQFLQAK